MASKDTINEKIHYYEKVNKKPRYKYNIHKMFIRLKDGQEHIYSMNGVEIDNLERFRNNMMERKFVNLDKKEVLFGVYI